MTGYRGYQVEAHWVEAATSRGEEILPAHWVFRVSFRGEWVDTFLNLEDLMKTIDDWKVAP